MCTHAFLFYQKEIEISRKYFSVLTKFYQKVAPIFSPCYDKKKRKRGIYEYFLFYRTKQTQKNTFRISPFPLHLACHVYPHSHCRIFHLFSSSGIFIFSFIYTRSILCQNSCPYIFHNLRCPSPSKRRKYYKHLQKTNLSLHSSHFYFFPHQLHIFLPQPASNALGACRKIFHLDIHFPHGNGLLFSLHLCCVSPHASYLESVS